MIIRKNIYGWREKPVSYILKRIKLIPKPQGKWYKDIDDTCWQWALSTDSDGYGYCTPIYGFNKAHRMAYHYLVSDIPKDAYVTHLCDNPTCVNPYHLKLGDAISNNKEIQERKRGWQYKDTADEVKAKMSAGNKGRIVSASARKRIGLAHKGKKLSLETKRKISVTKQGITLAQQEAFHDYLEGI